MWDIAHRRVGGFTVEVTRYRSIYAILAHHAEFPHLSPIDTYDLLKIANRRNAAIVGMRHLDYESIAARIRALQRDGLLARCDEHEGSGERSAYDITRLGAEIVGALAPVGVRGVASWGPLVRATRLRHHLPAYAPIPPPLDPPDAYTLRLATGMSLGALDMRWAYSVLIFAAVGLDGAPRRGPVTLGQIRDDLNRRIALSPDLRHGRRVGESSGRETVAWLERAGLLDRVETSRRGRRPLVRHEPTALAHGLLDALWQASDRLLNRDVDLHRIVLQRAGRGDEG